MRSGRLEAAIVALPVDDEGLSVRPVVEDELCFVSADPALLQKPMTIERLAELPLILPDASYGRDDPTRRQLAEIAQRAGVTIETVVDIESETTAFELAARGSGHTVAWLGSLTGRSRPLSRKLGWTTFRQPIHMWLAFVFRRGAPLSPAAREMSAIVEERLLIIDRQLRDAPSRRLPGE